MRTGRARPAGFVKTCRCVVCSATPLIVSHSTGLSLAYIEAGVYSELLPPEGVTLLSISGGGGALLPPHDAILDLPPVYRKVPNQKPVPGAFYSKCCCLVLSCHFLYAHLSTPEPHYASCS